MVTTEIGWRCQPTPVTLCSVLMFAFRETPLTKSIR
jgi:hypothetical protein